MIRWKVSYIYLFLLALVVVKVVEVLRSGLLAPKSAEQEVPTRPAGDIHIDFAGSYNSTNDQLPCFYAKWPAGWGNVVFDLLHSLIAFSRDERYHDTTPCILGYGGLIGGALYHYQPCPSHYVHDKCWYQTGPFKSTMRAMRDYTNEHIVDYPNILRLNATFVDHIFARTNRTYRSRDLERSSCAVHLRLGDQHSRRYDLMTERDRKVTAQTKGRACRERSTADCFSSLMERVRQACPNPHIPTYVASDVPEFLPYFCEQERLHNTGRSILSSCDPPTKDQINHINDVTTPLINQSNGYSFNPEPMKIFLKLYSDWLTLALSNNVTAIGHSTFSQTANFPYYTETPPRAIIY